MSKKLLSKLFVLLLVVGLLFAVAPKQAQAATLDVCPTCTYTTIQAAINAAADGDTISIAGGTYVEDITNGTIVPEVLGKRVNLIGAADGTTILQGSMIISLDGSAAVDDIRIENIKFLMTDSNTLELFGVNGVVIKNSIFDGNNVGILGVYRGVEFVRSSNNGNSDATIENCQFTNSLYTAIQGYVSNLTVKDSTISGVKSGINLQQNSGLLTVDNTDITATAQAANQSTFAIRSNTNVNIFESSLVVVPNGITPVVGEHHSAIWLRDAGASLTADHNTIIGEVYNATAAAEFVATPNWWGQATGPAAGQLVGNVSYVPWCSNDTCTELAGPVHNATLGTYHTTIQAAINEIEAASVTTPITYVVNVAAGEYVENLVINKITDTKSYEILGAEGTILKGTVTINSNSAYHTSTLLIKGIDFVDPVPGTANTFINFGATSTTRYVSNVTVEDCSFTGSNQEDIGFGPGSGSGAKNIVIKNCAVNNMGSLAQLGAGGLTIEDCTFTNSLRGVNLQSSTGITIEGMSLTVPKYAVRVGQDALTPTDQTMTITDSTLISSGPTSNLADPETALVLRGDAPKNIVITNSTISNSNAGGCDIALDSNYAATATQYTLTFTNVNWGTDGMKLCGLDGATIINNTVHNLTKNTWFSTIQAALNAAVAGDVIEVGAGTYTENLSITTPLTLQSTNWAGKIVGDINIKSSNVTLQGLDISHPGFVTCINLSNDQVATGEPRLTLSDISILNNKIHDVGGYAGGNTKAIKAAHGPDNVTIEGNQFYNITNTVTGGNKTRHTDAISFGDSSATDPSVGVVIRNNTFVNITSARDQANAISFNNNTGVTAIIENNTFEMDTIRGNTLGTLIGLERQVPGIEVRGNTFQATNPANIASNTHAIYTPRSDTVIEKNKFLTTGNMVTAGYSTVVDVTGNWWGQATGPRTGQTVYRLVDTNPWCANAECTEFLPANVTIDPVAPVVCGVTPTSTIDIRIAGIPASTPLQGYSFRLHFDPTMTTVAIPEIDVVNGGFIANGGILYTYWIDGSGNISTEPTNILEVVYTQLLPSTSTGGGKLASITLTHKGVAGDINLALSDVLLPDNYDMQPIPVEVSTTPVVLTLNPAVLNVTKDPDVGYCTLAEAVTAADAGDVLQLQADITIPTTVTVDKSLTLDLNGKVASYTPPAGGGYALVVSGDGALTVDDTATAGGGAIRAIGALGRGINVKEGGALVVNGGAIQGEYASVYVQPNSSMTLNGGSIGGVNGTTKYSGIGVIGEGATLTVTDGSIQSYDFAIFGNGSAGNGGTTINIQGGAITSTGAVGEAIYHPQAGTLNISGGTITGHQGVEMRNGTLNVTGGTIHAIGNYVDVPDLKGGWSTDTGDAIYVGTSGTGYGNVVVNISGTPIITSDNGFALREEVLDGVTFTNTQLINVTGGTFYGGIDAGEAGAVVKFDTVDPAILKLTGGLYNTDPADPIVYVFVPYGTIPEGSMFRIVGISLNVNDFYYKNSGTLRGVSTDFYATNFLFSEASSVVVELFSGEEESYILQQTNTLKVPTNHPGSVLTSSFDFFGTYISNSWENDRETEFGQTVAPTRVLVTVVLPGGTLTAENTILTGDRTTILPGVNGLVTLQGILAPRAGVPIYLTSGSLVRDTTSTAMTDINYWFTGVETLTYTFTTSQARYLNVTTESGKTFLVNRDLTLTPLRLYGGDVDKSNEIGVNDASLVGAAWGSTEDPEANINYDGIVNIQDLALVGGNFGLTSATAYDWWSPLP